MTARLMGGQAGVTGAFARSDVGRAPGAPPQPTLLFDGDCGFCTWVIGVAQRFLRPRASIIPWQHADLRSYGLTREQCERALQWFDPTTGVRSGGSAVAALLRASPQPWSTLGVMAGLPGVAQVVDLAYRLVARYRYRLPGSTPACALPRATP